MYNQLKRNQPQGSMPLHYLIPPDAANDDDPVITDNHRQLCTRCTTSVTDDADCKDSGIASTVSNIMTKRSAHHPAIERLTLVKSIKAFAIFILVYLTTFPAVTHAFQPKYETAYACEGKTLIIECEPGDLINLIRANYGRFSITICNDHGNTEWSVNCMSPKSLRVLHSKCAHKQSCSVLASTNMFGDPCPGTHKYLEAHYQCVSAAHTSTTTHRPSPPWLITSQPSLWSTSTLRTPTTFRVSLDDSSVALDGVEDKTFGSNSARNNTVKTPDDFVSHGSGNSNKSTAGSTSTKRLNPMLEVKPTQQTPPLSIDDNSNVNNKINPHVATTASVLKNNSRQTATITATNTMNKNTNNNIGANEQHLFCGSVHARNLFWNVTRVGEVNVQPCPGGATGIAKWRCIHVAAGNLNNFSILNTHSNNNNNNGDIRNSLILNSDSNKNGLLSTAVVPAFDDGRNGFEDQPTNTINNKNTVSVPQMGGNSQAHWQPNSPDLSQCRSLWLNNLEVRVHQRDSSLISIATDLSQVTSSKTLYGGDMLVTTKIIQIMSEKMTYDIETFPDQRQREAIIFELLNGVIKTGSNLLDSSQQLSWIDLSFEDQMRVATALLTGLEDNAFLLADTIIREKNVVQKVKNILLSIRVLETRNIVGNEIFPDPALEQWTISDDTIELPRGALVENSEGGLVRIVFVAFDRLEVILRPTSVSHRLADDGGGKASQNSSSGSVHADETRAANQPQRVINSKVISASLGKGKHIQLSQPIRLVLRHLRVENVTNPSCVFWSYIDHAWSSDGCSIELTNKTHTICTCNHLTNFAILMDVMDMQQMSLLSIIDENIRVLIFISITICIIFILLALVTLKLFNGYFVKQSCRTVIYNNLYACLLLIEILFLVGIEISETNILCGFIAALLHCLFLCCFGWMFFEGFQLYIMLTTDDMLLEVEKSSRILWYYFFTYGLSFLIVAISLAINPIAYTQADYCLWMEPQVLFYSTFLLPIVVFVLANLTYSAVACYIVYNKYKTTFKNKEHTRLTTAKFYLRCSFIFLLIFTLGWFFGYLYMRNKQSDSYMEQNISMDETNSYQQYNGESKTTTMIYGYLFVSLNLLQGIYIFIFHCIQNDKVRREYFKFIQQQTWLPRCLRCTKSTIMTQHTLANATPSMPAVNAVDQSEHMIAYNDDEVRSHIVDTGPSEKHFVGGTPIRTLRGAHAQAQLKDTIRGGHISPSLSVGSVRRIYNVPKGTTLSQRDDKDPRAYHADFAIQQNLNDPQYEGRKLHKRNPGGKFGSCDGEVLSMQEPQMRMAGLHQEEEFFYWTADNSSAGGEGSMGHDPANVYPSYKKKMAHTMKAMRPSLEENHLINAAAAAQEYNYQFQHQMPHHHNTVHNPRFYQHQHQISSDDDHPESHLIHGMHGKQRRGPGGGLRMHPHPNEQRMLAMGGGMQGMSGHESRFHQFYQQQQQQQQQLQHHQHEEPVYEEIMSNRSRRSHRLSGDEVDYNYEIDDESEQELEKDKTDYLDDSQRNRSGADKHQEQRYPYQETQPPTNNLPGNMTYHESQGTTISRNLSAILDENNTVICYLEPLPK